MRILTVRQPWAWAIIHGGKDVENRTRNVAGEYRGPVAIHVATACPLLNDDCRVSDIVGKTVRTMKNFQPIDGGHIIGVVDLIGVHRHSPHGAGCVDSNSQSSMTAKLCSRWAEPDVHHLVFANPRALDEPIPYKGGLGLRKTNFGIAGDWLYEETDRCTCGTGASIGGVYGHEPGCGLEPVARLAATS